LGIHQNPDTLADRESIHSSDTVFCEEAVVKFATLQLTNLLVVFDKLKIDTVEKNERVKKMIVAHIKEYLLNHPDYNSHQGFERLTKEQTFRNGINRVVLQWNAAS